MAVKDIASNIAGALSIAYEEITTTSTTTGEVVDTADFGEGIAFFLFAEVVNGRATIGAEESEDGVSFTAVIPRKIIGNNAILEPGTTVATPAKIGLFSTKRYVRPTVSCVNLGSGVDIKILVTGVFCSEYQPV